MYTDWEADTPLFVSIDIPINNTGKRRSALEGHIAVITRTSLS